MIARLGPARVPWVDQPLDLWTTDDIEEAHRTLVGGGATAMLQIGGDLLPDCDGIPLSGIREVPGGRLAVLRAEQGDLVALWQNVTPGPLPG
jgi:hypothetical protein